MKKRLFLALALCVCSAAGPAADWFVDASRPDDGGNGTSWPTAKKTIQAAIDLAGVVAGDAIWVTNGVYGTGGRPHTGQTLTNRVYINKAVSLQSVNGPSATFIVGRWHVPGDTNNIFGPEAVRCVYMINRSALAGFTLTNGATHTASYRAGGGVYCESTNVVVSNCVFVKNYAHDTGGGIYLGTVYDCLMKGNTALGWGGGMRMSVMYNCTAEGNRAGSEGGGVGSGVLYNCLIVSNIANYGAGSSNDQLYGCVIKNNTSPTYGPGGAYRSTMYNCTVMGNTGPSGNVGGVRASGWVSYLYNCLVIGNVGTGCDSVALFNCIVVGNSSITATAAGANNSSNWNSIIYGNKSSGTTSNYSGGTFNYCCAAPLPAAGSGNIDSLPGFVDPGSGYGANHVPGDYHLTRSSPCFNAGVNLGYMTDPATNKWARMDMDGHSRIQDGTVDMGAYEYITRGTRIIFRGN